MLPVEAAKYDGRPLYAEGGNGIDEITEGCGDCEFVRARAILHDHDRQRRRGAGCQKVLAHKTRAAHTHVDCEGLARGCQ
jgi:hypothetical protein